MTKSYDIIIAGAGSAGFVAAVQAGRLGKKVLLCEKNGMPGGILTVGGNNDIAQFWAHNKQVIAGIGWEYVKRLESIGGAQIPDMLVPNKPHWYYGVHVNIPLAAHLMDEMLLEAGVELRYEQTLCDVVTEPDGDMKRIAAVRLTSKSGLETLSAKTYIDCTGDGDLSVFAGADYECGTPDEQGLSLQPGTVRAYLNSSNLTDEQCAKIDAALAEAIADGSLEPTDTMRRSWKSLVSARYNNINHISRKNGADSREKTEADIEGRRCVARIIAAVRRAGVDPDFITIAPETAMRETRRIKCDGYVTADDYVAARRYPDGICNSFYPIDLHRDGMGGIQQVFLTDGQVPSIPLSALTVSGISDLYVAGRCASGDRLANSAYRVKASCMAMGQAAGAAAALACGNRGSGGHFGNTRGIDFERLKAILAEHGAILPTEN